MTSRDFCYWLQGFFELGGPAVENIGPGQTKLIQQHLAMVFKHEIDPSAGNEMQQAVLQAIHDGKVNNPAPKTEPWAPGADTRIRC